MALTPNNPRKRMEYVVKTYWEKDPGVVLQTLGVALRTLGLEHNRPFVEAYDEAQYVLDNEPVDYKNLGLVHVQRAIDVMPQRHDLDFILPWSGREVSKLTKAVDKREISIGDWENALNLLQAKSGAIARWAKNERIDILKVNLAQALEAVADYEVEAEGLPQGAVVYRFADGYTVQELRLPEQLRAEGEVMQHCVGSYCTEVEKGDSHVYSLRDPNGKPHVTIEWRLSEDKLYRLVEVEGVNEEVDIEIRKELRTASPEDFLTAAVWGGMTGRKWVPMVKLGQIEQIYGKQNEAPKEKYRPYVKEFIEQRLLGDPVGLVMIGEPGKGFNWRGVEMHALSGTDLDGRGWNFDGADLRGAVWGESFKFLRWKMDGVRLEEADLPMAEFLGVSARRARFDRANLTGAEFEGRFDRTTFVRATMDGSWWAEEQWRRGPGVAGPWSHVDLSGADLTGAQLAYPAAERPTSDPAQWLVFFRGEKIAWDRETIWPDGGTYDPKDDFSEWLRQAE